MKKFKIPFSLLACFLFIFGSKNLFPQDLPVFHIVDNESIGLTPTIYEKFGVAVADFDRNGFPDICCTRWQGVGYSRIFLNNDGVFQDITSQTPIEQIESTQEGRRTYTPLWVDYDNDGDKDLCFSTVTTFHLLRNDNNNFTDVAREIGLVSYKPSGFIAEWDVHPGAWADFDLDGDLDFVASQLNNPNLYLFRNDGDLFTNVATEAGLDNTDMTQSWSLTFEDVDLDGDVDLYSKNTFYFNEDVIFTDATEQVGISDEIVTNYREMFDYDNDGDLDYIKVSSDYSDDPTIQLWENQGGNFFNVSEDVALSLITNSTRAISIGDFDNDGDQDVFVHNNVIDDTDMLLLNEEIEQGDRVFVDIADMVGITVQGDRKGAAFMDYNMDGFLDIYMATATMNHILYSNEGNDNNWIGIILEGTTSNRDAIGSLVTLYTSDKSQIRAQKCGNHVANQNNPYIHFGIGQETEIDSVVIRWPLGERQVLTNLAINQYHNVKESDISAVSENKNPNKPVAFDLAQNYPNPFNPQTQINFSVGEEGFISLDIYNLMGMKVVTIANGIYNIGQYSVAWDGKDQAGKAVSSGVYMYRLKTADRNLTKKMMLIQ